MSRVVHFEIQAEDPARCAKFYKDVFGWEMQQWGEVPYWMVTTGPKEKPGINGGILPRKGKAPENGQPVNAYVCTMEIEDIDATIKKIEAAGGTLAMEKVKMGDDKWSAWQAYYKDTEGNIFGIHQTVPVGK